MADAVLDNERVVADVLQREYQDAGCDGASAATPRCVDLDNRRSESRSNYYRDLCVFSPSASLCNLEGDSANDTGRVTF
jgi:hypothetical protein